jgi:DNA polymerase-3 subunit delta'
VATGRISHAYLFTGLAGSNKTQAAYAFAQAAICERGGCGTCDDCQRIQRRKHPDVRYFAPAGASGYLVEQVRDIVADAELAPIRAKRKAYIIDRVDLLGVHAANAFLKTLEEPKPGVILILLGRTRDSVLPTIVSRCQVVPFRQIPANEAVGILVQNTGVTKEKDAAAIQACGGSLSKATEFVRSPERMAYRQQVLEGLASLRTADDPDIIALASQLVLGAKAPLDEVRARQERELAENADFLAASALRRLEARNKNAINMSTLDYLRQLTGIVRSWLRDVLVSCDGMPNLVVNADVLPGITAAAAHAGVERVARALRAVDEADESISYNVSLETCIDVLLFDIREALYETHSPHKA